MNSFKHKQYLMILWLLATKQDELMQSETKFLRSFLQNKTFYARISFNQDHKIHEIYMKHRGVKAFGKLPFKVYHGNGSFPSIDIDMQRPIHIPIKE